ncbi:CHAD domain-containing protein (plasmid) [Rhizobium sp. CCGE531]|nr:CHAD domain-containing protein [Rhizobium sp. CCGE531]AYG76620.1 CHAD domain-containing protein [Rhizobium sp. CCGE532]
MDSLVSSDLLGEPAETVEQHSVYFDTDDRRLFDAGFTLRIRRSGAAMTQTVKATGPGASLFARSEWETAVETDVPVLDHTSPLLNQFGDIRGDLFPQFEVSIDRRIWSLIENGSKIELAVDRGAAAEAERQTPICEIELELKDGDPKDLFALARKIEAIVPFRFSVHSKAERGYRLLDAMPHVYKSEEIDLEWRSSAMEGFQTIAQACFRQFRLNETVLLHRRSAEALHQARVAMRRLRSAISLFKPLLDDEAGRLSDEFRWLAGVLGEARNIDVLLPKAKDGSLADRLQEAREAAYDEAEKALGSPRARALLLDFHEWLHTGTYLDGPAKDKTIAEQAVEALDKMRKKLKKHGRDLARVDDERRHEARKDAKKLRYAAEFFKSLFAGHKKARRHKRFIKTMGELQDRLGALNDLATGPSVLDKHGLRDHAEAASVILHADKGSLIAAAQAALDDVLDAKRFWR